jgi:hypothetical protein
LSVCVPIILLSQILKCKQRRTLYQAGIVQIEVAVVPGGTLLPNKCEALSSIPSTAKRKERDREREEREERKGKRKKVKEGEREKERRKEGRKERERKKIRKASQHGHNSVDHNYYPKMLYAMEITTLSIAKLCFKILTEAILSHLSSIV